MTTPVDREHQHHWLNTPIGRLCVTCRARPQDDPSNLLEPVLRKRFENGWRHLHHRDCIHNLPPEQQVEIRGRTVEWWLAVIGPLPGQITPEDWETEPPVWPTP